MSGKCVLTFYSLPDTANEDSYTDVWQKYVQGKVDGVACKNVFSFDMNTEKLIALLKQRNKADQELLEDIKLMQASGASYMFVAPTNGDPVYGAYIADYLA